MKTESDMQVISKAKALATHTMKLTSNCNRYPKKYRFSLVDKMQNGSLDIYIMLLEANRTDLSKFRAQRSELQSKAISHCDALLFYIELSMNLGLISTSSTEYWSKMVCDVKFMTIAWRTKEKTNN